MSQTALISALILMCFLSLAAFFQWIIFLRMNNTSTTFKKSQEELEQEETEESEIDKRIMLDSNDADVQKAFFGEDNSGKKTATTDLDPLQSLAFSDGQEHAINYDGENPVDSLASLPPIASLPKIDSSDDQTFHDIIGQFLLVSQDHGDVAGSLLKPGVTGGSVKKKKGSVKKEKKKK